MSKIKQINPAKIVLPSIIIFFTAILILSLPVLLNYNSIQNIIEKKVSSEFKINLKILDDISLKIFPKPHYFVKKAILNLNNENDKSSVIQTKNLKVFIPLNKLYSKKNIQIEEIEIEKANIYFKLDDVLDFRNHLYYKINKPIYIKKSNFFLIDKNNETILISPIKKINYSINTKSNSKELKIKGNIFDVDYNSSWKRYYNEPKNSLTEIKFKNPNLFIKSFFSYENNKNFSGKSLINFLNNDIFIDYLIKDNKILISSPNQNKNQKIKLNSKIELDPFFIDTSVDVNNTNTNFLIDHLLHIILNSKDYLGNINGTLTLNVNNLKNSIINNGKINISIKEEVIKLESSLFEIEGIGKIKSDFRYYEKEGDLIFVSENMFEINNKKEFSRKFQLVSKNIKNINRIYFDLEKNIENNEISISNIYLNKIDKENTSDQYYIIKNLQVLKGLIKKLLS
tara:strand:- start:1398 stop:2762 length:1365 start_codon:yes stop_codon:yes gene_type:complete